MSLRVALDSKVRILSMRPLVSILIPMYNASRWADETMRSVLSQTWKPTEIIVIDDGSRDETLSILRRFESKTVKVVTQDNQGGGRARNRALSLAQGDYVQWLDHDDLLAPDKIERQLESQAHDRDDHLLLSGTVSTFLYCVERARPIQNAMCRDLEPIDYFLNKLMGEAWLQIGSYLFSRRLVSQAGGWHEQQSTDDDGDYIDRAVMASRGILFVPESISYWRIGNRRSAGHQNTRAAREVALRFAIRTVDRVLSMEDSPRTREACVQFMRSRARRYSYPEDSALQGELQKTAARLVGREEVTGEGFFGVLGEGVSGSQRMNPLIPYIYYANMFVKRGIDRYFWKNVYYLRSKLRR
jgi:glycosyltransferase involved in cell wall biosynthesis